MIRRPEPVSQMGHDRQKAPGRTSPRRTTGRTICFSLYLYRAHNRVERFFNNIKTAAGSQRARTSSPPTTLHSSNLRQSGCRSLNRILHPRSGGPVSLPFSIVDSRSSHPSIPIFRFKGRRHLLPRNDINQQRLEDPRIATPSQQLSDG
jgi:hypothetical protein